jgi:SAM-dependent methyltransferase
VAKRTGKTHENLENQITPPPTPRPATSPNPTVSRPRPARTDRSGPIGISGGDFATGTPTARKRTTTQPRGLPVVSIAPTPPPVPTPPGPSSLGQGAQPEAPFAAPVAAELGDAASQLAAEAAAARALDSGPLTPPPELDPPVEVALDEPVGPAVDDPGPTPPPDLIQPEHAARARAEIPPGPLVATPIPAPRAASEGDFSAHETPWPELDAPLPRVATPTPGAIPTDAIDGVDPAVDDAVELARTNTPAALDAVELSVPAPIGVVAPAAAAEELDVAAVDELDVVDGAEGLDPLPAEALADSGPISAPEPVVAPPRAPAAPPPIPAGPSRRKTGELRAPEVPTAQVVASIVPGPPTGAPGLPEALAQRPRRPKRSKPWFEEVFDEDYLRTLPFMSADQTLREVEFIEASLGVKPGSRVLDIGCGYGRHAIELVQRGLDVTGLDLSLPLLIRAADEAQRRAMSVNFVHADMREMAFEQQFDGAYCMLTSFGYFDEETNLKVAEGMARALKPGARLLLDLVNRDYVVGDLPSRVWWEGNGCVVLEEVDFNFHTSRILTHRSIVFEDGRQIEQEISVRAYSLHEVGRLLRQAGFRVLDISGSLATRGNFFGQTSRSLLILAEKRTDET